MLAAAQDQIFKKDNTKIDAKILEINQTEIRYKLFTYQEGPTIVISKSDVAMIIYQNGSHEVFNTEPAPPQNNAPQVISYRDYDRVNYLKEREAEAARQQRLFDTLTKTKQVVFLNLLDVFNGSIGLSYLREFAHNKLNVYVPLSAGFTDAWSSNTFNLVTTHYSNVQQFKYDRKVIEAGLGINYQVSNRRAVTYFAGPLFTASQFNGYYTLGYQYYYGGYTPASSHSFVVNNYAYMINNGFLFRFTPNFNFMINAAMGYQHQDFVSGHPPENYNSYTSASQFPVNCIKLGFHVGYRF